MDNNESLALKVINEALKLPYVKVDRSEFLVKQFGKNCYDMNQLIEEGPQSFLSKAQLDQAAQERINAITAQSSALSFATGLPGGLAIAATIPADIAQFYGYSLKLAQEVSYIYGYEPIWNQQDKLTEETKNRLILYLGIMLGVTSAGAVTRVLSKRSSIQEVKELPYQYLAAKSAPVVKEVLAALDAELTKTSFTKGISKVIPVLGGIVSGGANYLSMNPMATRLKDELGKSVNYAASTVKDDLKALNIEAASEDAAPQSNTDSEDIFSQIERAHSLLEKGLITEEEFKLLKQNILSK